MFFYLCFPVLSVFYACFLFHFPFQQSEQKIAYDRQKRDQKTTAKRHCRIIDRNTSLNRYSKTSRSYKRRDRRHRDCHNDHISYACYDDSRCQWKFDFCHDLEARAPHSFRRRDYFFPDAGNSRIRISHHRHDAVNRKSGYRRLISDPQNRDQHSQK